MQYCNSLCKKMQFASVQAQQGSFDMKAQCGSPMEDSWTANGLACLEVDGLAAATKTGFMFGGLSVMC